MPMQKAVATATCVSLVIAALVVVVVVAVVVVVVVVEIVKVVVVVKCASLNSLLPLMLYKDLLSARREVIAVRAGQVMTAAAGHCWCQCTTRWRNASLYKCPN
ncbi:hypothetical protein ElyMa_004507300 [Elysia marginata]|uniref:Secreted protein n=1 Tax=Elysia marginata TaxID=1093978 RepID=A0AAV4HPJ9_9GAST|nr:hypothetical protein ElyMa_004507300 [Elysia marginata]